MINRTYHQNINEPFPCRLYIRELETELTVAEYTIQEAGESLHRPRKDYHKLLEHTAMLEKILQQNGILFPEIDG